MVGWSEYKTKTVCEMKCFESMINNGADFFVNCMIKQNHFMALNVKPFHCFTLILQSTIDNVNAADPNPQNFGFYFSQISDNLGVEKRPGLLVALKYFDIKRN